MKGLVRKAKEYADSDEFKEKVGKTKAAAGAVGDRAVRAARGVKDYATTKADALTTDQPTGRRLRDNVIVVAVSMLFFFPLGL